ncbi:hypothetical protein ES706_02272 [subsurface metagenome]
MKKLRLINRSQKGFTLIELLVAIAIAAVVGATVTVCIQQVMAKTVFSNNQLTTLNQVRNVGYWINHDVVMSQPGEVWVITGDDPSTDRYELLQLKRKVWNETERDYSSYVCNFTYYFLDNTGIQDLHREDYNATTSPPGITDIIIAQYIDVANTNCTYEPPDEEGETKGSITLNVTARYPEEGNSVVKTKTFQISFRLTA